MNSLSWERARILEVLSFLERQRRSYALCGESPTTMLLLEVALQRNYPLPHCIVRNTEALSVPLTTLLREHPEINQVSIDEFLWNSVDELVVFDEALLVSIEAQHERKGGTKKVALLPFREVDPYQRGREISPPNMVSADSLDNASQLGALRNKHAGTRAFIIGNGPSLRIEDLTSLQNEITFASNRIYLSFDSTAWRPSYYSVIDVLVAQRDRKVISQLDLPKIFPIDVWPVFRDQTDITWARVRYPLEDGKLCESQAYFSSDPISGFYPGWTVIYHQLQLAAWMGIKEVYLLGIDFKFSLSPSTDERCRQGEVLVQRSESNHFDPRYRLPGEKWSAPRLDLQRMAFTKAREAYERRGAKVYNCSRASELDVFERVAFEEVLGPLPQSRVHASARSDTNKTAKSHHPVSARVTPRISIVLPVLNGAAYLDQAIDSVRSQTLKDWELIIVDDGSFDKTPEIAASYVQDNRIIYLTHPDRKNLGVHASRMRGLNEIRGEYLAFLDADDMFLPEKLERQSEDLSHNPEIVLVHSKASLLTDIPESEHHRLVGFLHADESFKYRLLDDPAHLDCNRICTSTVMIRADAAKTLFGQIRELPQEFQYEDWLMWLVLCGSGDFFYRADTLTQYRYHQDSATAKLHARKLRIHYSNLEFYLSLYHLHLPHVSKKEVMKRIVRTIEKLSTAYTPRTAESPH